MSMRSKTIRGEVDDAVDLVDLEKEDKELEKELKIPAPKLPPMKKTTTTVLTKDDIAEKVN